MVSEAELLEFIDITNKEMSKNRSFEVLNEIAKRKKAELLELEKNDWKQAENMNGRQSGSVQWRTERGEYKE